MIDVHCHLSDNKFKSDAEYIVQAAKESGVSKIISVAEFPSQFDRVIEQSLHFRHVVYAGIGVHPIQKRNKGVKLKHLENVEDYLSRYQEAIVCVGEIGLDRTLTQFKLSEDDLKDQEDVFRRQIRLANQFQLPINVHSRSAAQRTQEILKSELCAEFGVVLHAFDGSVDEAIQGSSYGFYYSVPPSFIGSERAIHVIKQLPINQLLLETDAPALGPTKGERNEPRNLKLCANFIAEVKNMNVDEVIEQTTRNAHTLFSKIKEI